MVAIHIAPGKPPTRTGIGRDADANGYVFEIDAFFVPQRFPGCVPREREYDRVEGDESNTRPLVPEALVVIGANGDFSVRFTGERGKVY